MRFTPQWPAQAAQTRHHPIVAGVCRERLLAQVHEVATEVDGHMKQPRRGPISSRLHDRVMLLRDLISVAISNIAEV